MHNKSQRISLKQIQWITWALLFSLNMLTMLRYDSLWQTFFYSFITITSYMIIVYGNANLLIPHLYQKDKKVLYFVAAFLWLLAVALYRSGFSLWGYNTFFAKKPESFAWVSVLSVLASSLLIYFTSVLFYISIHYFRLREQQEALQRRHIETELNLLKAQVQPHFLFNTLNNIYFYAQRESPQTAALLEKLSLIMRYFVDEAPRDKISIQSEMNFIRNYIDLEKARMRYPLEVTITENHVPVSIQIPPMLIIPLVENVFKHGIDKRREDNFITIGLSVHENRLHITVKNRIAMIAQKEESGKGLSNLRSRLDLLYDHDYLFSIEETLDNLFIAELSLPL